MTDERLYTRQEMMQVVHEAFRREIENFGEVLETERIFGISILIGALEYGESVALHAIETMDSAP